MTEEQKDSSNREFNPLAIMGLFWLVMGLFVWVAVFFVEASEYVSKTRGIMTNIAAGSILTLIGLLCIYRGRHKKKNSGG